MLKTTEELWIKYIGGETGKKHISQDYIRESAALFCLIFPTKQISTRLFCI